MAGDSDVLAFSDLEKKKKEEEKQINEKEIHKLKETQKRVEISRIKQELENLKFLIEQGFVKDIKDINIELSEKAFKNNHIISEIFQKIEQIEKLKDIDNILPKEHRITKQEYLMALKNPSEKEQVIKKLEKAINFIYNKSFIPKEFFFNIFGFLNIFLNQQIRIIQKNLQGIKDSLKK